MRFILKTKSRGVKNTLHLRLRVRKVEEAADRSHIHIDVELQAQDQTAISTEQQKGGGRIIHIGPLSSDEEITEETGEKIARKAFASVETVLQEKGFLPMFPKPLSALVCLYITKQHFAYLGRPTVDDYIELNARTDRGH